MRTALKLCFSCIPSAMICVLCLVITTTSQAAEQPETPLPGLQSYYLESSEAILIKAHQYDREAIVQTALGYWLGIGGFPKNYMLASWWSTHLLAVNDMPAMSVIALAMQKDNQLSEQRFGSMLAMCSSALHSDLAVRLKEAEIFDRSVFCDKLEKEKSVTSGWQKTYAEGKELTSQSEAMLNFIITSIREFRDQPCSKTLTDNLYVAYDDEMPGSTAFYAATTHNTALESPDWSTENLLKFLTKINACLQSEKDRPATAQESAAADVALAQEVGDAISATLFFDNDKISALIRTAHNASDKDMHKAVITMSEYYRAGLSGFIKSSLLANLWLQYGAMAFDDESGLALAANMYAEKQYPEAWAWATMIVKDRDADAKIKAMASSLRQAIEAQTDEDTIAQGKVTEDVILLMTQIWLDWLKKQSPPD